MKSWSGVSWTVFPGTGKDTYDHEPQCLAMFDEPEGYQ